MEKTMMALSVTTIKCVSTISLVLRSFFMLMEVVSLAEFFILSIKIKRFLALVGNIFLMSKIKNNSIKIQNMGCYPCTQDVYKVKRKKVNTKLYQSSLQFCTKES